MKYYRLHLKTVDTVVLRTKPSVFWRNRKNNNLSRISSNMLFLLEATISSMSITAWVLSHSHEGNILRLKQNKKLAWWKSFVGRSWVHLFRNKFHPPSEDERSTRPSLHGSANQSPLIYLEIKRQGQTTTKPPEVYYTIGHWLFPSMDTPGKMDVNLFF